MWRFWEERTGGAIDLRLALYSGLKQFVVIFVIGILLKLFVCDSLKVEGSQMEPSIRAGDRILLFKTPYNTPLVKNISARKRGKPVVIALADKSTFSILRIAGVSGDTVSIMNGQLYRNGIAVDKFFKDTEAFGVIPADYSPSDFMNAARVPAPGDSIDFRSLNMRDFISAYAVFSQETPNTGLKAHVLIADSIVNDYPIRDFALYQGRLDSIPEDFNANWFFWDKLQGYLRMKSDEGQAPPQLAFTVLKGGKEVGGFRVKNRYLFLLGDNWSGARDSRHFGPIMRSNVKGRPLITLWGFDTDVNGNRRFNGRRIGRFVK